LTRAIDARQCHVVNRLTGEAVVPIIAIATTKGGSGKTTLTACLADWWRRQGHRVACLDTDPNRNLMSWIGGGNLIGITCSAVNEDDVIDAANTAQQEVDVVIIDVAGVLARGLLYAVGTSDAVIIPCRSTKGDVIETGRTQQTVISAGKLARRDIPHAAVLTQVNRRAQVTAHTRAQLEVLGIPTLEADLAHRTAYQAAWYQGVTPLELGDNAATTEIGAIAAAVERIIEGI
jgi:chromosome partitioning protein